MSMEKIADYQILKKLDETPDSTVYQGKKENENTTVIIKVLKTRYPSPSDVARFKQEFELIKNPEITGIVQTYDFLEYDKKFALILEDFPGTSLKRIIPEKIDIPYFLDIAIHLAHILGKLHKKNIIHKNIKPHSVSINRESGEIKITDFGICSILTNSNTIEESLYYMSPEQTGRMNRDVDYRTDLYSLGITFYEMLTRDVPFKSKDPMELIYSHIAREPESPVKKNNSVPEVLSNIIMKLLAKTAEERYQNSFGLLADLKECHAQLTSNGTIKSFELGMKDIPVMFSIPRILIGREKEIKEIMEAYDRVVGGADELLYIIGPAGIGKSALINEIKNHIALKKGYFCSGKYDQLTKGTPYTAIIQAFRELANQILAENEETIRLLKENLLKALGPNGKVITEIIPDVELIIGKQPNLPELGPDESQNRFRLVFKNFIKVFCNPAHPVVIFLDDIHWAEPASFEIASLILTDPEIKYIFVIAAYREDEVDENHLIIITQQFIKQMKEVSVKNILLDPLDTARVNSLISNLFRCTEERSLPLAELIHKKTNGNPFFINRFLNNLHQENMLELDPALGWKWDIEKIREMPVTDNVVKLLTEKITGFNEETRNLVKTCACIGNRFDLATASTIANRSIDETLALLTGAAREGIFHVSGDLYMFFHDRIRETVYSLIPEEEKVKIHFRIGTILLEKSPKKVVPDDIFSIVNNLNYGAALLSSEKKKINLAELNLIAAEKAKKTSAYFSAVEYLTTAAGLLPNDRWINYYKRTYAIYKERIECEYLNRNFEGAETLFKEVIKKAKSNVDKADILIIMILLYTNMGKLKKAITLGISGLKMFGISLPFAPNQASILEELVKVKWKLAGKKIEDLLNNPEMKDEEKLAANNLLVTIGTPAIYISTNLSALIILKCLNLQLKYGNSKHSAISFIAIGNITGSWLGDFDSGYKFGKLALDLNKKMDDRISRCKVEFAFAWYIQHTKEHARNCVALYKDAYRHALEAGDMIYAGHSINLSYMSRFMIGENIGTILEELKTHHDLLQSIKDPFVYENYLDNIQLLSNLSGLTYNRYTLNSDGYDEDKKLQLIRKNPNKLYLFNFLYYKMFSSFFNEKFSDCLTYILEMESIADIGKGVFHYADFYIFYSLTLAALYPAASSKNKKKYWKKISRNQEKTKKWAENCPENFIHKYYLIEAERARISGQYWEAGELYKRSIETAKEHNFIHIEGAAAELAARFYLDMGFEDFAIPYITEAYDCYLRWGLVYKTSDLKERYSGYFGDRSPASSMPNLDISTIIKTSEALSGEIYLGSLLKKIMELLIENAGARIAYLILKNEEDGKLYIEAEGKIDEEISVLQGIPFTESSEFPSSIVNYVYKTGENVVVHDAHNDSKYGNNPYILAHKPKSILCAPIRHKAKVTGIAYLENDLTANAFTPERLRIGQVLLSQAAISIENSHLSALREDIARTKTQIEIAANIQSALVPEQPSIDGYDITAYMKPAENVGGDYYDIINMEEQDWVIIGDVAGHGVLAGLVMMMIQTSIQVLISEFPGIKPSELLRIVNKGVKNNIENIAQDKYMTITALSFNKEGRVIFSGLHLDLFVYRASTETVERVETDGLWLSYWDLGRPNDINHELLLNHGDVLLLHTDGITEARDLKNNQFSEERLMGILKQSGFRSTVKIRDAILKKLEGYSTTDDVTMVILKREDSAQ
ncbi:MAG: AAA family ATPase [bacterium]|nr:AAA family ATPase [bacterium]